MNARITFNELGYIQKFINDVNGEYPIPEDFDFDHLHCYHLVDGALVLDAEAVKLQNSQDAASIEIAELKKKLTDTDYIFAQELEEISALSNPVTLIADLIKILISYASKYKDVIASRKEWRARIEELEQ